jgi:hypothetical protein
MTSIFELETKEERSVSDFGDSFESLGRDFGL